MEHLARQRSGRVGVTLAPQASGEGSTEITIIGQQSGRGPTMSHHIFDFTRTEGGRRRNPVGQTTVRAVTVEGHFRESANL